MSSGAKARTPAGCHGGIGDIICQASIQRGWQ